MKRIGDIKTIVMQKSHYSDQWNPVAILTDPRDIYPLIEDWEKKFQSEHSWKGYLNGFSIGDEQFKVTYAYEWGS